MQLNPSEYEVLVESSPQMVWRCRTNGARDYFNRTWLEFTGCKIEHELGEGWLDTVHPDDIRNYMAAYVDALDKCVFFEASFRLRRHDGQWRLVKEMGTPFFGKDGAFEGYVGSCVDIDEQARIEHLKDSALTDDLTGLYRRRYFETRLDDEIRRSKRYSTNLSLIKLDIDEFKSLNKKYGRPAADKVLKGLAHIVRENTRSHDIAGRLSGDEFFIALPYAKVKNAELTAERIRELVQREAITFDRKQIDFSISLAVVALIDEISAGKLINKADRALFEAKHKAQAA